MDCRPKLGRRFFSSAEHHSLSRLTVAMHNLSLMPCGVFKKSTSSFVFFVQQVKHTPPTAIVIHAIGEPSNNMQQVLTDCHHVLHDNNIWVSSRHSTTKVKISLFVSTRRTWSLTNLLSFPFSLQSPFYHYQFPSVKRSYKFFFAILWICLTRYSTFNKIQRHPRFLATLWPFAHLRSDDSNSLAVDETRTERRERAC